MKNKKIIVIIFLIIISIFIWYISSVIARYIRYIIIFPLILWAFIWFFYNIVLKRFWFNSKNYKFIIFWIILSVIVVNISNNYFNYQEAKNVLWKEMQEDVKKITLESKKILKENYNGIIKTTLKDVKDNISKVKWVKKIKYLNLYNKIKNSNLSENYDKQLELIDLHKIIIKEEKVFWGLDIIQLDSFLEKINKNLKEEDFIKASDNMLNFYDKLGKITWLNVETIKENIKTIKENLEFSKNDNLLESIIIKNNGVGGQLWFFLETIKNSWTIDNHWDKVETGFYWSIIIYIIDLIALYYWIFILLDVLKIKVCKIHNKWFEKFWKNYNFSTTLENFNWLDIEEIIKNLNTKVEKKWFFSNKKNYFLNVSFKKCPECKEKPDIEIIFTHFWKSRTKPLLGAKEYSFIVNYELYEKIKEKIEEIKNKEYLENQKKLENLK